jgi:antitoxin ParD1/3/4
LDELRKKLAASRDSGVGSRTVDELFDEARDIARARGLMRD